MEGPYATSTSNWALKTLAPRTSLRALINYIRREHVGRIPRVMIVGAVGFVIQTTIFETIGIRLMIFAASTAAVLGGECAILSNFFLNNRFSFQSERHRYPLILRLIRFHVVSSGSLALQWLFVFTAERMTSDVVALRLAYLFGIGLGFLSNYAGYYFFVWQRHKTR